MIYCNLAVLLAERHLKISKVSTDTGISRTTITALCQNYGKGVQIDTLNSLCMYLNITIGELYSFFPFDINVLSCNYYEDQTANLIFNYTSKQFSGEIHCFARIDIRHYQLPQIGCYASIDIAEYDSENAEDVRKSQLLSEAFHMLPQSVIEYLKSEIADTIIKELTYKSNKDVEGDIYGYPESIDEWDIDVSLPSNWK